MAGPSATAWVRLWMALDAPRLGAVPYGACDGSGTMMMVCFPVRGSNTTRVIRTSRRNNKLQAPQPDSAVLHTCTPMTVARNPQEPGELRGRAEAP